MKCSKKVVVLSLVATLVFGSAVSVFAADGDVDVTDNHIKFKADGGSKTDPVDPEDPDETIVPDDKEKPTNNTGTLRLDVVPRFEFGENNIVNGDKSFDAKVPEVTDKDGATTAPYYTQVTDVRGTGDGWTLSAKMTVPFTDEDNHTLDGAKIELKNAAAASQDGTDVPTAVDGGFLEFDGANTQTIDIATAAEDEGMGVTAVRFGDTSKTGTVTADKSVVLTIPGSTQVYAKDYEATVKWTLVTGP